MTTVSVARWISGALLAFAGLVIVVDTMDSPESPTKATTCKPSDQMPAIMAKRFVEKQLRAPSTASFPRMPEQQAYIGECAWQVLSYVDAQNGFGAMVRTHWLITMMYDPETKLWSSRDLRME